MWSTCRWRQQWEMEQNKIRNHVPVCHYIDSAFGKYVSSGVTIMLECAKYYAIMIVTSVQEFCSR